MSQPCPICGAVFPQGELLALHVNSHFEDSQGEAPFPPPLSPGPPPPSPS